MSSVGSKGVIIQDTLGGDSATVTDGRLDVNATIGASVSVALDSDEDSVECIQDTAADLNATIGNAIGNAVYTRITNGSVVMPTMDVAGRPGFVKITDGTNLMPTMDAIARAGYVQITDGSGSPVSVTGDNELEVHLGSIANDLAPMATYNTRTATATNTKVTVADSTTEIVDSLPARYELTIVNDGDTVVYLGLGENAVLNEGVRLNPNGGSFSTDVFTEAVDGIVANGLTANVTVLEMHT